MHVVGRKGDLRPSGARRYCREQRRGAGAPTDEERRECVAYVKESKSAQRGLEDVLWGLLNTKEFLLNH